MGITLSILIGFLEGMCGVFFKIGEKGKATAIQATAIASAFGVIMFAYLGRNEWSLFSWRTILVGFIFGASQYAANVCIRTAMVRGPLSPLWCAFSLNFVPVIVYCSIFLGEKMSIFQYFSIICTIGAILVAAFGSKGDNSDKKVTSPFIYGLILLGILLLICVLNVGLKFCSAYYEPNHTTPMADEVGNLLMFFTYLFLGLGSSIDNTINKAWAWNRYAIIGCLGASLTAPIAYCITVAIVSKVPAITLFALSYTMSLLTASLSSVFFFKEKKTLVWWLSVSFSLLAILLNR